MSSGVAKGRKEELRPPGRRPGLIAAAAGVAGLTIIMSFAGAYDTDDYGLVHRLLLWLVVSGLIVGQAVALHEAFARLFARAGPRRAADWRPAATALAAVVPLLAIELHLLKFTPLLPKAPDPFLPFVAFVTPAVAPAAAFAIAAKIYFALAEPRRLDQPSDAAAAGAAPTKTGPFADWPSAPVMTVKAYDHYLEVATAGRTHFVRGRMKDAVATLAGADGLQIHRSWWAARDAVARIESSGRDKVAVLKDGRRAPVARARLRAVAALISQ